MLVRSRRTSNLHPSVFLRVIQICQIWRAELLYGELGVLARPLRCEGCSDPLVRPAGRLAFRGIVQFRLWLPAAPADLGKPPLARRKVPPPCPIACRGRRATSGAKIEDEPPVKVIGKSLLCPYRSAHRGLDSHSLSSLSKRIYPDRASTAVELGLRTRSPSARTPNLTDALMS